MEYLAAIAALTAHPQDGDGSVWFNYGNLLLRDHRYVEAIREYKVAVGRMPAEQAAEAYLNLGIADYKIGDRDAAEQQFRKALEIDPNYADAQRDLELLQAK